MKYSNDFTYEQLKAQTKEKIKALNAPEADYLSNYDAKTILRNPNFLRDLRDVYASQDKFFDNDENLIDQFFSDNSWKEFNSVSAGLGYVRAMGAEDAVKEKMARVQEVYDRFPNFWEEGGRSTFDALSDAVPAAVLDPINLIPLGKAAMVGKVAAKAGQNAFLRGAGDAALKVGAVEGGIGLGFGALREGERLETGQQDEINYSNILLEGAFGAGLGGVLGGAVGGVAAKLSANQTRQLMARKANLEDALPNLEGEEAAAAVSEIGQINRILENPNTGVVPTDAMVTPPPSQAAPEPDAPVETPLTPLEMGDNNLVNLTNVLDEEMAQLEKDMGFNPGYLSTLRGDDLDAFQADGMSGVRFDPALYEQYAQKVKLRSTIETIRRSKNTAAQLRDKAQKAADKGDLDKATKFDEEARVLEAKWDFYAKAKGIEDLEEGIIRDPDISTFNSPQLSLRTARGIEDFDAPASTEEFGPLRTPIASRVDNRQPEVDPEQLTKEELQQIGDDLKVFNKEKIEADNAAFFEKLDEDMKAAWQGVENVKLPNKIDFDALDRQSAYDKILANKQRLAAIDERMAAMDDNLQKEWASIKDAVDIDPVVIDPKRITAARKSAKKLGEPKFKIGFDPTTNTYRQVSIDEPVPEAVADPVPDADPDPVVEKPKIEYDSIKVTFRKGLAGTLIAEAKVNGKVLDFDRANTPYDINPENYDNRGRPQTYSVNGAKHGRLKDARANLEEELKQDIIADPAYFGLDPNTPQPDRLDTIAPNRFLNEPDPEVPGEKTTVAQMASLIDPGDVPEGLKIALIKDGETPLVAGPRQREQLTNGKLDNQSLMKQMLGRNSSAGWESVFVPIDTMPNAINFSEQIIRPADIQRPAEMKTFDFDINERDSIPTLDQLENDAFKVKIPDNYKKSIPGYIGFTPGQEVSVQNVLRRMADLEDRPLRKNKQGQQKIFDEIYELGKLLPAYRLPEQSKLDAVDQLVGEKGVLSNADPESISVIRDLLRRASNSKGVLPKFTERESNYYVRDSGYRKGNIAGNIGLNPKKSTGAHTVGHELFHWAYNNILTPTERLELNRTVVDRIYDADGKLDLARYQEMSPLPLPEGTSLFDEIYAGSGLPSGDVISEVNVQELLANQFNLYMLDKLPEAANVFQKISYYIQGLIDRFLDGKRLDPELARRFDRILPETAQDLLKGTKNAETPLGLEITDAVDTLQTLRLDLEKSMAIPGGVGKKRLTEHGKRLVSYINNPRMSDDVKSAITGEGSLSKIAGTMDDLDSPTKLLAAANNFIDAHEAMDTSLKQAFKNAEGGNLAPAYPTPEPQMPNTRGMSGKGTEAARKQIEVDELKQNLTNDFNAAMATGDRLEIEGVFAKYAGKMYKHVTYNNFKNAKVFPTDSKNRISVKDFIKPISDKMYGISQSPNSRIRDFYSNLTDDDFMRDAKALLAESVDALDKLKPIFINASKRNRSAVKLAGGAQGKVSSRKTTNRGKAKTASKRRRTAAESKVSSDALLRTLSDGDIDNELRFNSEDKRAIDLSGELDRRQAARLPDGVERLPVYNRRIVEFLRQEDVEFRGVQLEDGIPNDAPAMVREGIRKITHRDPDTQRMARGLMYRLNNLSGGDQLRLLNIDDVAQSMSYGGDAFNAFRGELRQLARSVGGTGRNKVLSTRGASKKIADLVLRASPPDADRYAAIQSAFDKAVDPLKQGRSDTQWFAAHLANAITGKGSRRPFIGETAFAANDALEAAVESAAYLMNGFIRSGDMKRSMSPLMQYGDIFENIVPTASPKRKLKEKMFTEGGLGADADGNSVAWYHGTPDTTPFASKDFIWEPSRASDNPRFGPGIYLGSNAQTLMNIYGRNPTLASMNRLIENQVDPAERNLAETLAYALSSTRMQINDINMQMSKTDAMPMEVIADELTRLKEAEEGLVETLSEMGLKTMPGVVETRVRAIAPLDIRDGVMYTIHNPNIQNMMDVTVDRGLVSQTAIDELKVDAASLKGGFEGSYIYTRLVEEIMSAQGLSEGLAKGELSEGLQSIGYDSLRVTEQNRLPESGVIEHEALVVFTNNNVKSPDSEAFDTELEFFNLDSREMTIPAPVGSLATAMIDSGGVPDPNRMGAIIGEMEKSGLKHGAQVLMKRIRRQPLTPQEEELLHKANPLKYLMNNAERLRHRHMHWLADWTKPREGAGFHEKEISLLAGKVMPLMNAIRNLTGETPLTKWKDTVLSDPFSKKVKQHPKSTKIVKALRRGEKWAKENLQADEMGLYNALRSGFDSELQAMNDLGIGVGRITNYFPQVYDIEAIQTHQDEFIAVIAEMVTRDRIANPNKVGQNPRDARTVAQEIMLRIVDEEGVYIPEQKMRTTRNGKNPHTDYNRVLNLSAVDDLGRLRYGDILEFMEDRGFLVNNLDGVVAKYFEGTNKKILMHDKFGHGNHGYHDYVATRGGGAKTAVDLLSSDKVITRKGLVAGDFGSQIYDDVRVTEMRGFKQSDAQILVDNIVTGIADGSLGIPGIRKLLQSAKPNATASDLRRFEAIANGMWEYENFGAVKQSAGDFSDAYFAAIQGRNLEQTQASRMARQASKAIRNFNSITLLSYTTLTSLTDLAIPFLRGARMRDSINMLRETVGSSDSKAEYRAAISNIGAAMESQIHQRMSMLYGSAGGRLTNQFFAANLLAPWTNLQRNVATATGYELLKAQQKIALNNFQPNKTSQNRQYKTAKRMLSEFGLGEYLTNGRSLDDLSLLDAQNGDPNVRTALHRFANETIFTPNKTDVPLWAQGPVGAVVFQLKSYPLMFQRLAGKIFSEAGKGNFVPMTNFLALGTGAGVGTLMVKDLAQSRGGEDDKSIALRERKLSSMLESMGYDVNIHGSADEFLGWTLQAQIHLGGLGLLSDIFYNIAAQADNGLYGATRILSTLAGPTAGAALDGIQFGQGVWDQALDLSPESNAKERAAWRFAGSRIPLFGGNRFFREGFAEIVGGEDEEEKSSSYGASYGSKFGSNYGSNYGSK